jgi:hypothetical protein
MSNLFPHVRETVGMAMRWLEGVEQIQIGVDKKGTSNLFPLEAEVVRVVD